jgi:hypothetical protein
VALSNNETRLTSRRNAQGVGVSATITGRSWTPVVWMGVVAILVSIVAVAMTYRAAKAAPADGPAALDCVGCHSVRLGAHSKLGSGNQACEACHASADMKLLRLANGTGLPLSSSPLVCAQCHQSRYSAWETGTHGFPGFVGGKPVGAIDGGTTCTACHNAHEPRIAFDFTKPHPEAVPPPPTPPRDLLFMLGITLAAVAAGVGYTLSGRGQS